VTRAVWAVLVIAVLAAACTSTASPATPSSSAGTEPVLAACPAPGAPAGAVEGAATVPLRRLTGRPMVVNLWASWCGPCREELPALARLSRAAGDRLRVIGVASLDVPANSISFASESRLPFPSLQDRDGDLERGLRRNGLPVTVLVRADGAVAYVYQGAPLTDTTLRELIQDRLGVHV
jgi:cytochrome c biogenesis protein CcmG, thiol:disulfide interchange protein DsbE